MSGWKSSALRCDNRHNFGSNHEFPVRKYRLPIGFLKKQSVKSEVPEIPPGGADTVTPTVHHVFEDICYDSLMRNDIYKVLGVSTIFLKPLINLINAPVKMLPGKLEWSSNRGATFSFAYTPINFTRIVAEWNHDCNTLCTAYAVHFLVTLKLLLYATKFSFAALKNLSQSKPKLETQSTSSPSNILSPIN